jgi:cytochrome c peroxidase
LDDKTYPIFLSFNKRKNNMKRLALILLFALAVSLIAWRFWWQAPTASALAISSTEERGPELLTEPILPLPTTITLDAKKVALGEKLFNDPQLSRTNDISCASCHSLSTGGVDNLVHSIGVAKRVGVINAPTIFNSGLNAKQFWDGRADSLEDQIDGPTHSLNEMDSTWDEILGKLKLSPEYLKAFTLIYPAGLRTDTVKDAIATFERSLSTPNSRFDRFLKGEVGVLSDQEKDGYRLFKKYGCSSCHQGANVGGNMFEKLGVMGDYFADRGHPTGADLGRFNVTGNEADRHVFKVPGLRNVALTAPYLHDGAAVTLEQAVSVMAKYQLGRRLSAEESHKITSFLKTLTGEYKGKSL